MDVLLSPIRLNELELLIEKSVQKAFRTNSDTLGNQRSNDAPGGIELAQRVTGLAKATIYTLVSERQIPHSKKGKKLYFSESELNEWIREGKRKTVSEISAAAVDAVSTNKKRR